MTICDAWTSLAVKYHTLTDRLFPETVVLTVEWCHLLFAVCVQSLNLQLVVTETYTGNILWQEDYCKDLGRHNVSTRTAALPTSLITRHSTVISCINCVASTEQSCSQCSTHSRCQVTYSLLNTITWTSHNCSQCSVSNLGHTFWHSAISPSQLYDIQLQDGLLWWCFTSFIILFWINKNIWSN
jgi:hypothetical protein